MINISTKTINPTARYRVTMTDPIDGSAEERLMIGADLKQTAYAIGHLYDINAELIPDTKQDTQTTGTAEQTEQDAETAPVAEPETETAETIETTETAQDAERGDRIADITKQRTGELIIKLMGEIINAHNAREGWDRGVKIYACELLDSLAECVEWAHRSGEPSPLESRETVRAALLNGAKNWSQYSWGGCSLIYSGDIAKRLCTPHRLNLHDGGNKPPIGGGEWLDQQAVALNQASSKVLAAYNRVVAARCV